VTVLPAWHATTSSLGIRSSIGTRSAVIALSGNESAVIPETTNTACTSGAMGPSAAAIRR